MTISSAGIGSGLDVNSIVTSLVTADITPSQNRITKQQSAVSAQISDAGKIKSALSTLQTSLSTLADLGSLFTVKATSSDESYFTATATTQAAKGVYQVEIKKLAQQQSIATGYIADPSDIGTGTLHLSIGKYDSGTFSATTSKDIVITSGNKTLAGLRDAINNSNAGVTASIVKDGNGSRLTITSKTTGEVGAIQIQTTAGLEAFKYDSTDTGTPDGFVETVQAQDSLVKINGLELQQSTNTLSDSITGISINLQKAEVGKQLTLTVDDDKDKVSSAVSDFVKNYNSAMTTINSLTAYNAGTKTSGSFQGDSQIRNLKMNLTEMIASQTKAPNVNIQTIADAGITLNKQGLLSIDQTKLTKALTDNYTEVGSLFGRTATPSDPGIQVSRLGNLVKPGTYNVNLTEYTPGASAAGTIGGLNANSKNTTLNGTGALVGLALNVVGGVAVSGSTVSRGTVTVSNGVAKIASDFLDNYLNATTGTLTQRINILKQQSDDIADEQLKLNTRQQTLTDRYTKQFSALDVTITKLQSTSSSLSASLSRL